MVFVLALAAAGCAQPANRPRAEVPPTTTALQSPTLKACLDTYAGSYASESPLASHPQAVERLELRLAPDWTATLTAAFAGSRHPPTVERGTWRCDGPRARVLLTESNKGPLRDEVFFELREGLLVSTRFNAQRYGAAGLKLRRL
jgi:hypothetical protein